MNDYDYQFKFIMIGDSSILTSMKMLERAVFC
jgi:hypothetical protein